MFALSCSDRYNIIRSRHLQSRSLTTRQYDWVTNSSYVSLALVGTTGLEMQGLIGPNDYSSCRDVCKMDRACMVAHRGAFRARGNLNRPSRIIRFYVDKRCK